VHADRSFRCVTDEASFVPEVAGQPSVPVPFLCTRFSWPDLHSQRELSTSSYKAGPFGVLDSDGLCLGSHLQGERSTNRCRTEGGGHEAGLGEDSKADLAL
jgi:hypothetical protein